MKRTKRLTRKERKDQQNPGPATRTARGPAATGKGRHSHIHCIACGKHLDPDIFGEPDGADFLRCAHGSDYPHCLRCVDRARELVEEHDTQNEPVKRAAAWH